MSCDTDEGSGSTTEGEFSSPSDSESEARRRSGIQMGQPGRTTLLKLVTSTDPKIENARNLLDCPPKEIDEELSREDSLGNSVIHHACRRTLVPWLELIIQHHGKLDVKGAGGRKPIHFIVRDKATSERHTARDKVKLIELLASKRALCVNDSDDHDQTPLHLACNHTKSQEQEIVIKALLDQPEIKVDEPVKIGGVNFTVLQAVCQNGHFDTALLLLEHGANPLPEDVSEDTPFFIIVQKNVEYARLFLRKCKKLGHDMQKILSHKNRDSWIAFHEVIKTGDERLIEYVLKCLRPTHVMDRRHDYLLNYKGRYDTNVMHIACMKGHKNVAIRFKGLCSKLLEQKTTKGLTPLHFACWKNHHELAEEICSMLQRRDRGPQLSFDDSDENNLLKFTALRGSPDCLVVLLKHVKDKTTTLKLLKWISVEKNLHKVLEELLIKFGNADDEKIQSIALLCAEKGQTESLQQFVTWRKATFDFKDGKGNNVMHLIAQGGHLDTAIAMLKEENVDYKTRNQLKQTPLHLAIKRGHREMVKLFLKTELRAGETDKYDVTPLMYACQRGDPFIVDLLLDQGQDEIKFFKKDKNDLTCLDHAINNNHERVAVKLLSQTGWRKLLTCYTKEGTTPMRKLIESMPGVCKFVLDKCMSPTEKESPTDGSESIEVRLDYELLEDWFSPWMEGLNSKSQKAKNNRSSSSSLSSKAARTSRSGTCQYTEIPLTTISGSADNDVNEEVNTNFRDNGRLKDGARIIVTDPVYRSQKHPLRLMTKSDESKELLNHPVVRQFMRHKQKTTHLMYWINFLLIIPLLILVTGHSLLVPPPFYVQLKEDSNNYTWMDDGKTKWHENLEPIVLVFFGKIDIWIILPLTIIYFLFLLCRVWIHKRTTLNSISGLFSIMREIALQVFTILFIMPGFSDQEYNGIPLKADWQWQLGAFAVFLAWFNFILSLQTIPFIGIYILMFLEVLSTLLNFIVVAGVFCLSFAVVFCILLMNQVFDCNQEPFHTLADSLGKTMAMMGGGIDYSGIFHSGDSSEDFTSLVFFPISAHVILAIFIIFVPIIIMNLLTGLAVYDVKVIRKKAVKYKRVLEAEGILDFQDFMLVFMWKGSVVQHEDVEICRSLSSLKKLLYKVTGYKKIHDQLLAHLEKTDGESIKFKETTDMKIETMAEDINDLSNRLIGLTENVIDIKTKH